MMYNNIRIQTIRSVHRKCFQKIVCLLRTAKDQILTFLYVLSTTNHQRDGILQFFKWMGKGFPQNIVAGLFAAISSNLCFMYMFEVEKSVSRFLDSVDLTCLFV